MALFHSAVLFPPYPGRDTEDAGVSRPRAQWLRERERSDIEAHAVVEAGLPADGLLVKRLPSDENVVGPFAFKNPLELDLEVCCGGNASVSAFNPFPLIRALTV